MEVRKASLLCCHCVGQWSAGEIYDYTNWAAVEEQYSPNVPVPVHNVDYLAAKPDRALLKLPI